MNTFCFNSIGMNQAMAETIYPYIHSYLLPFTDKTPPIFFTSNVRDCPADYISQPALYHRWDVSVGQWDVSNSQVMSFKREIICPPLPLFSPFYILECGVGIA